MKYIYITVIVSIIIGTTGFSQETIKVMSYNLLNFGNYTSYCTNTNNPHADKVGYLETIVNNQEPDIIAVCELSKNSYYTNYILGNALNVNGETKWQAASPTNLSDSYLINGLFFDKNKFELIAQPTIETEYRDINIYKLKCLNQEEIIYFNVVVAHLKAGSDDFADRAAMVELFMDYIVTQNTNENYIFVGDLNIYTDDEAAFQKLINPSNPALAFYDPIDQMGDWNNSYSYRHYHTQSTHDDPSNDCFSYGGFDDRFDFILISSSVKDGTADIKYVEDSYWAVGQDGLRYNDNLIIPSNASLPSEVIDALYNLSDHLPVVADFNIGNNNSVISMSSNSGFYANIINPSQDIIRYELKTNLKVEIKVNIYSLVGQKLFSETIHTSSSNYYSHNISNLPKGVYMLSFEGKGIFQTYRIIKQ